MDQERLRTVFYVAFLFVLAACAIYTARNSRIQRFQRNFPQFLDNVVIPHKCKGCQEKEEKDVF